VVLWANAKLRLSGILQRIPFLFVRKSSVHSVHSVLGNPLMSAAKATTTTKALEYTPLEFFQAVYQHDKLPLSVRMRAAENAAQYMHAKLTAVAVGNLEGGFASLLDKAIARSSRPLKLIEATPVDAAPDKVQLGPEVAKRPFSPLRRW
jgi:hypothetical protein